MSLLHIFDRKKTNQSVVKTEHQLMIEPDHDLAKRSDQHLTIITQHKEAITNKASP